MKQIDLRFEIEDVASHAENVNDAAAAYFTIAEQVQASPDLVKYLDRMSRARFFEGDPQGLMGARKVVDRLNEFIDLTEEDKNTIISRAKAAKTKREAMAKLPDSPFEKAMTSADAQKAERNP